MANQPDPLIQVRALSHQVSTRTGVLRILQQIDLHIEAGESVAIVGASGSGKSTLLGMLAGLDTPSAGEIYLAGQCITAMDEEARAAVRAAYVSFVFQNFQLLPSLTTLENIMLPLEVQGKSGVQGRAQQLLHQVGLSERAAHYPHELSGGEQQRVALARAFAADSPILFADEPTGNLDSQTGEHIIELLFTLNQQFATTLVLVTHDATLAQRCQRRLTLAAGVLQC